MLWLLAWYDYDLKSSQFDRIIGIGKECIPQFKQFDIRSKFLYWSKCKAKIRPQIPKPTAKTQSIYTI